jgi:hypothetical protein
MLVTNLKIVRRTWAFSEKFVSNSTESIPDNSVEIFLDNSAEIFPDNTAGFFQATPQKFFWTTQFAGLALVVSLLYIYYLPLPKRSSKQNQ